VAACAETAPMMIPACFIILHRARNVRLIDG
jgi:hypothetical protein